MPLHDWTRVNAGLFHHFHQGWCWTISSALIRGQLPDGYTALVETLAVGDPLPSMPLFIAPGAHIPVPLEDTYSQAWAYTPNSVRRLVG